MRAVIFRDSFCIFEIREMWRDHELVKKYRNVVLVVETIFPALQEIGYCKVFKSPEHGVSQPGLLS